MNHRYHSALTIKQSCADVIWCLLSSGTWDTFINQEHLLDTHNSRVTKSFKTPDPAHCWVLNGSWSCFSHCHHVFISAAEYYIKKGKFLQITPKRGENQLHSHFLLLLFIAVLLSFGRYDEDISLFAGKIEEFWFRFWFWFWFTLSFNINATVPGMVRPMWTCDSSSHEVLIREEVKLWV